SISKGGGLSAKSGSWNPKEAVTSGTAGPGYHLRGLVDRCCCEKDMPPGRSKTAALQEPGVYAEMKFYESRVLSVIIRRFAKPVFLLISDSAQNTILDQA